MVLTSLPPLQVHAHLQLLVKNIFFPADLRPARQLDNNDKALIYAPDEHVAR